MTPPVGRNLTGFGGDPELLYLQHATRVRFAPTSFDAPPPRPPGRACRSSSADPSGDFDYGMVTTE